MLNLLARKETARLLKVKIQEDGNCVVFANSYISIVLGYEVGIQHEEIFFFFGCCGGGVMYFEITDLSLMGFVFV